MKRTFGDRKMKEKVGGRGGGVDTSKLRILIGHNALFHLRPLGNKPNGQSLVFKRDLPNLDLSAQPSHLLGNPSTTSQLMTNNLAISKWWLLLAFSWQAVVMELGLHCVFSTFIT